MTDTLKYSRAAFLRTAARMALCAALCATITLFGCGKDAESAGAENGGMPDEMTGEAEDMFRITDDYVIIIPEGSKADAKAANLLKKGLSDKGIVLKFIDDSYGVNEHEIILGPAARDDAKKTNIDPSAGVMPGGWEIKLAESGNLIVSGDTYAAAQWLLDSCVGDDGFLVSEDLCESYTPDWELVFEDDFDGDELDETKWRRCPEWDRSDMGGRWDDGMIFLDGRGHLVDRADIVDGNARFLQRFVCDGGDALRMAARRDLRHDSAVQAVDRDLRMHRHTQHFAPPAQHGGRRFIAGGLDAEQ